MNKPELSFRWLKILLTTGIFLTTAGNICICQEKKEKGVKLVRQDDKQKVDVYINGSFFTSYQYPSNLEKPFLFPVNAPDGSVVTRGFPLEPRKGERVDHPHQIGLWFNHGNVNGLDFWNNSSAIPPDKKDAYGHIVVQKIDRAESGKKKGTLGVVSEWKDNKGNTVLTENTLYIFSADKNGWIIDHISTLTASAGPVKI
ncbi:MAG: PmoA family protein, partial [Bacteroidales bacterium]|nr:PmoA family protein [Bacteroidales bacterium]